MDHRSFDIAMARRFLNRSYVIGAFEDVWRKGKEGRKIGTWLGWHAKDSLWNVDLFITMNDAKRNSESNIFPIVFEQH